MIPLTRRRLWFGVFVLLVFVIGLATGVVLDRYLAPDPRLAFGRGLRGMPPRPAAVAERLSRELDLTAEQRQQLEDVFRRNAGRLEAFRMESRTEFDSLRDQLRREVEAVLTVEQREKLRQRERGRPRRPSPRPPK